MPTMLLIRHGRSTANTAGVLAGRAPGVDLDDVGREQVSGAGRRLASVPLAAVVSSPLERCRQTAAAVIAQQPVAADAGLLTDDDLTECDYGQWQGRGLAELASEPLWAVVQQQPSAAVFPDGESLAAMQARAVAAVRRHDDEVSRAHGGDAVWAAVSHGDVIKAVLADALGMHLDLFQRLDVHPASISVIRYGQPRPQVLGVNTTEGDLSWLRGGTPPAAQVGGGAGPTMEA
jgi:probable phosphomutase (TIGR03848 family)